MKMNRWIAWIMVMILLAADVCAAAELDLLQMPDALQIIDEEAFYGAESIGRVVLSDGTKEIRSKAFADSSLKEINLPDGLESVADDAFDGCDDLVIAANAGKWQNWASNHGFEVKPLPAQEKDFKYTISDGEATITAYVGNDETVVIPDTLGGSPVAHIGESAFSYNPFLEGEETGEGAEHIRSVYIPDGVKTIGVGAFQSCYSLARVEIPESVETIGKYAFADCGFQTIDLPKGILIADMTFSSCENLKWIDLEGVHDIGREAFEGCLSLEKIAIPGTVERIGNAAFACCSALKEVTFGEGLKMIGNSAFTECAVREIVLPESATSIGEAAFYRCEKLVSAVVPSGVTSIGEYAFEDCADGFVICGASGSAAEEYASGCGIGFEAYDFVNPASDFDYTIENGEVRIDKCSIYCKDTDVIVPATIEGYPVTEIGEKAFFGRSGLISVKLQKGMQTIGYMAFAGCKNLETLELPDGLSGIGIEAFNGCSALKELNLPDGLETIAKYAFEGCTGLKRLEIPEGVNQIGEFAFEGCTGLESVVLPETVRSIQKFAFGNCKALKTIVLPAGLVSIQEYGFSGCSALESLSIPEQVFMIGKWAFANCTSLKKIVVPENVTTIGEKAFTNCHPELVIYGNSGSDAETHALAQGISFAAMDSDAAFEGRVICGNSGVPGIRINLFDNSGKTDLPPVYTDARGYYRAEGLLSGRSYIVSCASEDYSFTPAQRSVTAKAGTVAVGDFKAAILAESAGTASVTASCNTASAQTGETVEYTLAVENANMVRLIVDGVIYESYACDARGGLIQRAFTQGGSRIVQFQAGYDGAWGGLSEEMPIEVYSSDILQAPVVAADAFYPAGEDVELAWQEVENAQQYHVYLYRDGIELYRCESYENAAVIPAYAVSAAGSYTIVVMASAQGYEQSEGAAHFTMLNSSMNIEDEGSVFAVGEQAEMTVAAPGADWISYSVTDPALNVSEIKTAYGSSARIRVSLDAEGEYKVTVSAGVNGMEDTFARQEFALYAYQKLALSQYRWEPASSSETAAIRVEADAEWKIGGCSEGVYTSKSGDMVYVSLSEDCFDGRMRSVDFVCGLSTASLFIQCKKDNTGEFITLPGESVLDNGDFAVRWNEVPGASAYRINLKDDTARNVVLVREIEGYTAQGETVSGSLLLNGHSYTLTVEADIRNDQDEIVSIADRHTFAVSAGKTASVSGRIVDLNAEALDCALVKLFSGDRYIASAEADDNGSWSIGGLAPGHSYVLRVFLGSQEYASAEINAVQGTNAAGDILCPVNEKELETVEFESEGGSVVHSPEEDDPVSVECGDEWLTAQLVETYGFTEVQLTAAEWSESEQQADLLTRNKTSGRGTTAVISYGNGRSETVAVRQNAAYTPGATLEEMNPLPSDIDPFVKRVGKNKSTKSATISKSLSKTGKVVIEKDHTIVIDARKEKKMNGVLTIDGNLEILGKLEIKGYNSSPALYVMGNMTIAGDGSLSANDCNIFVNGSTIIKDNGVLTVNGYPDEMYERYSNCKINGDIKVCDNAGLVVTNEAYIATLSNVKVSNKAYVQMSGGKIEINGDLVYNTSSDKTALSAGTIQVSGDAKLKRGYTATSADHRLEMKHTDTGMFSKKDILLKKDRGQKIGTLQIDILRAYSIDVEREDCFDSNIPEDGSFEIEITIDMLKKAFEYDSGIRDYYQVTGSYLNGQKARKLEPEEETAIIMGFLQEMADTGYGMTVANLKSKVSGIDRKWIHVTYSDGKELRNIRFYVDFGAGLLTEYQRTMGFASIEYEGGYYLIGPKDLTKLDELVNRMATDISRDATEQSIEDAVDAFRLKPYDVFGKNGTIQYLKKAFKHMGIDLDEDPTYASFKQLKKGLEAVFDGDDKAYEEAVYELLEIAAKAK